MGFVDQTLGNDSTGAISYSSKPFLTHNAAAAAITDATSTKRYGLQFSPGLHAESSIQLKPYVFICGCATQTTRMTSATGYITASSAFAASNGRSGCQNAYAAGSTGVNIDLYTLGGPAQSGVFDLSNSWFNGAVIFKGRAIDGTGATADELDVWNCLFFSTILVDGGNVNLSHCASVGGGSTTINATYAKMTAELIGSALNDLTISANSGFSCDVSLTHTQITGAIVLNGANVTCTADEISLSSATSLTITNGATLVRSSKAKYCATDTSFSNSTSFTGPFASAITASLDYEKQGYKVTMYLPAGSGTGNSTSSVIQAAAAVPAAYRPAAAVSETIIVAVGSTYTANRISVDTSGNITIYGDLSSGTFSPGTSVVQWLSKPVSWKISSPY